jgi:RNA polymerase sigma-70 factor
MLPGRVTHKLEDMVPDAARGAAYLEACAAWPDLTVSETRFGEHLDAAGAVEIEDKHAGDVLLACAALDGQTAAHRQIVAVVDLAFVRMRRTIRLDDSGVAEARQIVLERLLLGGEGQPALTRYAGRGALVSYVQVVATRVCFALSAEPRDVNVDPDRFTTDVVGEVAAESLLGQEAVREAMREAFRQAIVGLSARDRLVLRFHYVHDHRITDIARLYGVDRSTMSRWIDGARARLWNDARPRLLALLPGGARAMSEAVNGVLSRIDLSLSRLLAES